MLTGHCREYGEGITLWPLREAVAQARGDRLGRARGRARHPGRARCGASPPPSGSRTASPARTPTGRSCSSSARSPGSAPLALVVDDAHWAEPALLDLLLDLVARLRDAPLLVVWVARPDLLERAGDRSGGGDVLTLQRAVGRRERVAARARSAAAACRPPRNGRWPRRRAATRSSSSSSSPTSTSGTPPTRCRPRCTRCSRRGSTGSTPTERAALALGAVAGDTFTSGSVHALATGLTRAGVEQRVRAAARSATCSCAGTAPGTLRFRHTLIRDVAYAVAGEVGARRAARAPRRLARMTSASRAGGGRRADRLPPRDRVPARGRDRRRRRRPSSRRGRASGSPRQPARRTRAATWPARSASSTAPSRCWATTIRAAPRCCRGSCPRCSSRARPTARRRSPTAPSRVTGALGLERVHARARIEREHIRLSCHPETFRPERSRRRRERGGGDDAARSATSSGSRARRT